MVLNIVFSFNRAMQLDYLLQSIIKNYKFDYKTVIIYHTTGNHRQGYELLKEKYKDHNITFEERKEQFLDTSYFSALKNKSDIKFFAKQVIQNKNSDNFKSLLENLLEKADCEFVMFNTDDGYYLDEVTIADEVFSLIRHNPLSASYRLYVGKNHDGCPDYVKNWGDSDMLWDYYTEKEVHHWSYPFAVDGTVYDTKALLKILKKVVYHNPVTLEAHTVHYVMRKKLLGIGISPQKMKLIGTKLNRVSQDSLNPTIHVKPDMLNEKFVEGYTLELELPENITNGNIVPLNVYCVKDNEKVSIYTLDEFGKEVQGNLGKEGAKKEMQ